MTQQTGFENLTIKEFLSRANSSEPVPGGGSVAAVTGALAASMGQMVLNLTIGKEKYKEFEGQCKTQLAAIQKAQAMMLELMDEDIAAFSEYTEIRKIDKNDPGRADKLAHAVEICIAVPQEIAAVALAMLQSMDSIKDKANLFLLSDLGVGAVLAAATVKAACFNVRANLSMVKDQEKALIIKKLVDRDQKEAQDLLNSVELFLARKL